METNIPIPNALDSLNFIKAAIKYPKEKTLENEESGEENVNP